MDDSKNTINSLADSFWQLYQDYDELADMIPADHPGSRLLPRLNRTFEALVIQMLCSTSQSGT